MQQRRSRQLSETLALIEETVPGVLEGGERGSDFEEKGKRPVPHILTVGQRRWEPHEEWDP